MNEKDGGMAGSPCLISVPGIVCSKEGIPLVPTGIEIQNNNDFFMFVFKGKLNFCCFYLRPDNPSKG